MHLAQVNRNPRQRRSVATKKALAKRGVEPTGHSCGVTTDLSTIHCLCASVLSVCRSSGICWSLKRCFRSCPNDDGPTMSQHFWSWIHLFCTGIEIELETAENDPNGWRLLVPFFFLRTVTYNFHVPNAEIPCPCGPARLKDTVPLELEWGTTNCCLTCQPLSAFLRCWCWRIWSSQGLKVPGSPCLWKRDGVWLKVDLPVSLNAKATCTRNTAIPIVMWWSQNQSGTPCEVYPLDGCRSGPWHLYGNSSSRCRSAIPRLACWTYTRSFHQHFP